MNKKHINAILCKVFDDFVNSIDDEAVRKIVKSGTMITGGAIVSLLTKEPVNDYDLYFKDFETCKAVTEYYIKKFNETHPGTNAQLCVNGMVGNGVAFELTEEEIKTPRIKVKISSAGVAGDDPTEPDLPTYEDAMETNITPESDIENIPEKPKYLPVYMTSNAITLSGKIQLVIRFYGMPEEIHSNYDFIHCTNYWTSWDRSLTLKIEALEAIMAKELRYVGSKYPLCSIIRTRKFITRGWTINAGQYLKMIFQCNGLDLCNIKVLEDQLVGVDSAYFGMLIKGLQTKQESDPNFKVDSNYVVQIINKIF